MPKLLRILRTAPIGQLNAAVNFKYKVDRHLGMTGIVVEPSEDMFKIKYHSPSKLLLFTLTCFKRSTDGKWSIGGMANDLGGEGWKGLMELSNESSDRWMPTVDNGL